MWVEICRQHILKAVRYAGLKSTVHLNEKDLHWSPYNRRSGWRSVVWASLAFFSLVTFRISAKDKIFYRKGKDREIKTKAVVTCVLWCRFCSMKWPCGLPDCSASLYGAAFGTSCPSLWHFHLQNYNSHTARIALTPHSRLWPCLQQYCLRNAARGSLQSGWCP